MNANELAASILERSTKRTPGGAVIAYLTEKQERFLGDLAARSDQRIRTATKIRVNGCYEPGRRNSATIQNEWLEGETVVGGRFGRWSSQRRQISFTPFRSCEVCGDAIISVYDAADRASAPRSNQRVSTDPDRCDECWVSGEYEADCKLRAYLAERGEEY